jgi:hypothetical protein
VLVVLVCIRIRLHLCVLLMSSGGLMPGLVLHGCIAGGLCPVIIVMVRSDRAQREQ